MALSAGRARGGLEVALDADLPATLPIGLGSAIFVSGVCRSGPAEARRLWLELDDRRYPALSVPAGAGAQRFWSIVELTPPPRTVRLRLHAEPGDAAAASVELGAIALEAGVGGEPQGAPRGEVSSQPLVAICMATFDPPPELFERQIESIRVQSHRNWVCVVSDDGSDPERFAAIERTVGSDPRFAVSRSERRLGFYRNFGRALSMVPRTADFVALADQDDRWHGDKLERLLDAIGGAELAYSDARVLRSDGAVVAESLWGRRRNNRTNLASLLLANTVTGAASLFRRDLLDYVLPLPPAPGEPYHDHWIALVALARGELAYVDRPLLDYVQHRGAVIGYEAINAPGIPSRLSRLRRLIVQPGAAFDRWREAYFAEYCRLRVLAVVLRMRCDHAMSPAKRRAVARFLAGERSPASLAWLAVRPLRAVGGRNETLGFEHRLLRGIAWRQLARMRPTR